MNPSRMIIALAVAVTTLLVAGALAGASIPDEAGVIHGCRNRNTGALRVIDSESKTCTSKEEPLRWSQTGPQGPQGILGYETVGASQAGEATPLEHDLTATCPDGKRPLGAGVYFHGAGGSDWNHGASVVHVSTPLLNGWRAIGTWLGDNRGHTFNVVVICALVGT